MPNSNRKTIFTTISIDKETATLVEKICKRYSLKKSEVVKLAFGYIDKAHINPSETPESVKSELAKINKRQNDIIRFRCFGWVDMRLIYISERQLYNFALFQ